MPIMVIRKMINEKSAHDGESESAKEKKHIHCAAFLDKTGRVYIPLRHRMEVGITGITGADVELDLVVKKIYK